MSERLRARCPDLIEPARLHPADLIRGYGSPGRRDKQSRASAARITLDGLLRDRRTAVRRGLPAPARGVDARAGGVGLAEGSARATVRPVPDVTAGGIGAAAKSCV